MKAADGFDKQQMTAAGGRPGFEVVGGGGVAARAPSTRRTEVSMETTSGLEIRYVYAKV